MHYFGRGLVETENDFGSQGSPPSHPELLDWLAAYLMDEGWSLKKLHRVIVGSATYRQSSHVRPEMQDRDPLNILLSRQNRIRLDAEIVRDIALQAAGKLSMKVGGPSVHPPQPDGVYAFTQNKKVWQVDVDENRYRRGMYTMFYRSAPYPTLSIFDTPDFQSVCTRRQRSNTPLQALTLANDEAFYELAQAMGNDVLNDHRSTDGDRVDGLIHALFVRGLCRSPNASEAALLKNYWQQLQADARDERAAATAVARIIMNTDEFITRE
jgi:hypothetical protein